MGGEEGVSGSQAGGTAPASGDRKMTYHVSPKEQGGWDVVREGAQRAILTGGTKRDVVKQARELAREKQAHLVIHKADGAVQDEVR